MIRAIPILLLVLAPLMASAEESWTEAISGEVRAGEDFKADLPGDLVFSLEADAPFGWTIAMRAAGEDPERDLVWPANPPYRFDNVRYLETSYGKTPEQMLAWNPRRFSFYDDPAAAEAAERWIEAVVLWPTDEEPPARPDPKGVGVFNILESRIGEVDGHPAVTWLRFEVRLAVEP